MLNFLWPMHGLEKYWEHFCKENLMKPIKFSRIIPIKSDSTYKILSQYFPYRNLLIFFFKNRNASFACSSNNWIICKIICSICQVFNVAIDTLSHICEPICKFIFT